jgi:hypothetical protein
VLQTISLIQSKHRSGQVSGVKNASQTEGPVSQDRQFDDVHD